LDEVGHIRGKSEHATLSRTRAPAASTNAVGPEADGGRFQRHAGDRIAMNVVGGLGLLFVTVLLPRMMNRARGGLGVRGSADV